MSLKNRDKCPLTRGQICAIIQAERTHQEGESHEEVSSKKPDATSGLAGI